MVIMATKKLATAKFENARVSLKSSKILCKGIKSKKVVRAKAMLEGMISGKHSLGRKYYTNTAKKILEVLKNAEANGKAKGMDEERLFVSVAKAGKGRTFSRPRSRSGRRGEQAKMTHLEIILEER
jgi:ribosomal protein L22